MRKELPPEAARRIVEALLEERSAIGPSLAHRLPEGSEKRGLYSVAVPYINPYSYGTPSPKEEDACPFALVMPILKKAFRDACPENSRPFIDLPFKGCPEGWPVIGINEAGKSDKHKICYFADKPAIRMTCFDAAELKPILEAMRAALGKDMEKDKRGR